MRKLFLGLAGALCIVGVAKASDYVVVGSTDPTIHSGLTLDAGKKLMLGQGRTVTLMRPSGEVETLRGASGGVMVPSAKSQGDNRRIAALALLAAPVQKTSFGARRGGLCPAPEDLKTLDAIVAATNKPGCRAGARDAFQKYLQSSGATVAAGASPPQTR